MHQGKNYKDFLKLRGGCIFSHLKLYIFCINNTTDFSHRLRLLHVIQKEKKEKKKKHFVIVTIFLPLTMNPTFETILKFYFKNFYSIYQNDKDNP